MNTSATAADLPSKAAEFARILQDHMPELEREYGVASLALFGSYVRGEEREDSDLDVLVDLNRPMGLLAFIALGDYLSQLVGRHVDLTTTRSASEHRSGRHILQEAILL